ncbi:MAG: hypothetical protein Q9208_002886 [Pyrenodesmia sp. 3 TL-2023]
MASTKENNTATNIIDLTKDDDSDAETSTAVPPPETPATAPKINDPPLTASAIHALTPKLNALLSAPATTGPLLLLNHLIETLVSAPPAVTSYHVGCLLESLAALTAPTPLTSIPRLPHAAIAASFYVETWGLWSHRLVTALVLSLAASAPFVPAIHRKFKELGRQGGMVDLEEVRGYASCDLRGQFKCAVREAGERGRTTVLGVQLVDVGMLERVWVGGGGGGRGAVEGKFGFGISFAVGVGPEGVVVWCAGGGGLEGWVKVGNARVGDWEDGEQWVGGFERLVLGEVGSKATGWNSKRFKRYRQCFGVDLREKAEKAGKELLEVMKPWVKIFRIDDVTVEDVQKWRWEEE